MSSLIVEVCEVLAVEPHPDADRLAIAIVKGWRTCIKRSPDTGKTEFTAGDKCVYFPPGSVMPPELAERLGIVKFLKPLPRDADGSRPPGYQVWAAYLRGTPSYGLIIPASDNPDWRVGTDVADYYGITKYEPPVPADPNALPDHPALHRYTDMQALANFPDVLQPGEEVVITEKIHGMNFRAGLVRPDQASGAGEPIAGASPTQDYFEWVAGSFNTTQRQFDSQKNETLFWLPFNHPGLRPLLSELSGGSNDVVAFGEIFGPGIMDTQYGRKAPDFCVFDISVNKEYLPFDQLRNLCTKYNIHMAPLIYRGPYMPGMAGYLVSGPTGLCPPEQAGRFSGREGIVVKSAVERRDLETLGGRGRIILKAHSVDFLTRRHGKDGY